MYKVDKLYFREIRRLLPCSHRQKKRQLAELEQSVQTYLRDHPESTKETLYTQFGQPNTIAAMYLEQIDPGTLAKMVSANRRFSLCIIAIATVLVVAISAMASVTIYKVYSFSNGYFIETIEELPPGAEVAPSPIAEY